MAATAAFVLGLRRVTDRALRDLWVGFGIDVAAWTSFVESGVKEFGAAGRG
jgi:hypothetical protein